MNALKRLNILDKNVAKNMVEALTHWNYKIRNAASENLKYFYGQDKYKLLIDTMADGKINKSAKNELDKIRKTIQ